MSINTNFKKVMAHLHTGLHPFEVTSGGIKFSKEFRESLYDKEEEFRSQIIVPINDAIGLHNWAVTFVEYPVDDPTFFADIYCDNSEDYPRIANIIKEKLHGINFKYFYKGSMATYLSSST